MTTLSDTSSRLSAQGLMLPQPHFRSPFTSEEQLRDLLETVDLAENALVEKCLEQAQRSHGDQRRDDGGPYLEQHIYPVAVSGIKHEIAVGNRVSAKFVGMLLTHDVPEDDPDMPLDLFREEFGKSTTHQLKPGRSVHDLVLPLTKLPTETFPGKTAEERALARKISYQHGLTLAEYESKIGKLADREQNVFSLHLCEPEKIVRKIQETEEFYLPLARDLSPLYYESITTRIYELKEWLRSGGIEV